MNAHVQSGLGSLMLMGRRKISPKAGIDSSQKTEHFETKKSTNNGVKAEDLALGSLRL